jgi:hypothetical protein
MQEIASAQPTWLAVTLMRAVFRAGGAGRMARMILDNVSTVGRRHWLREQMMKRRWIFSGSAKKPAGCAGLVGEIR